MHHYTPEFKNRNYYKHLDKNEVSHETVQRHLSTASEMVALLSGSGENALILEIYTYCCEEKVSLYSTHPDRYAQVCPTHKHKWGVYHRNKTK